MSKLNFQKYFDGNENSYYDSKYIIVILEGMLENSFEKISESVDDAKVLVNEEQIKAFLEQKLVDEDPELKQRFEKRNLEYKKSLEERRGKIEQSGEENWMNLTGEEIEESSQAFVDDIAMHRYHFEPYTLKYFNKYIEILKNKLLTLLDIIEKIGNRNVSSIQDIMNELDIILDENGNISKEDIIRLITPTIYNFEKLNKKVEEANELSTYLTFKMSKHSLMRDGWNVGEVYPQKSLQDHSLYGFNGNENVPLSSRQEQDRIEEQRTRTYTRTFRRKKRNNKGNS